MFVARHVLPVDRSPSLDPLGFLLDLENRDYWPLYGAEVPIRTTELAGSSSFVLLAPGAVGKTTALNHLAQREPSALILDLRARRLDEVRRELEEAAGWAGPVYVDHIDEVVQTTPELPRLLEAVLRQLTGSSASWRFGCRHAAWTPGLSSLMQSELADFVEYRLLPLSRSAAERLAAGATSDTDGFMAAVTSLRLDHLPSAPHRLETLATRWERGERLPSQLADAVRLEVDDLLREWDGLRPPESVSIDRRRAVSGRLGAFATISTVSRFAVGPGAASEAPGPTDLPDRPEPSTPHQPVSPDEYRVALGTGLFDAAGQGTVRFRHQQLAEYVAAEYLSRRLATVQQARQLLALSEHGVLPGRLVGVAGWLGVLSPEFVEHAIATNALVFAQSGVELPNDAVRQKVVRAILTSASTGDLEWTWGVELSALTYPGIAADLLRAADERWEGFYLPWWVARIAAACRCYELSPRLVEWAFDESLAGAARVAVVDALRELGDRTHLEVLLPLLAPSVDDELFGAVIEALYPQVLDAEELTSRLRPIRSDVIGGRYVSFFADLPQRLPDEALPGLLGRLQSWKLEPRDRYEEVVRSALGRAWDVAQHDAGLLDVLAGFIAGYHQRHHTLDELRRGSGLPWDSGPTTVRRALAVALAAACDSRGLHWYVLWDSGVVVVEDVPWLLDDLEDVERGSRDILADCIGPLLAAPDARLASRILSLPAGHYAHNATKPYRGACSLDSDTAILHTERASQRRERERATHEDVSTHPQRIRSVLDACRADSQEWWRLAWTLASAGDRPLPTESPEFSHDLTRRTGWQHLTDQERREVIDMGLGYLAAHTPLPEHWHGKPTITISRVYPDWAGVYLMTTLAKHESDRLRGLDPESLIRWAPCIVGAWNFDRDEDRLLRSRVAEIVTSVDRVRDALAAAAREDIAARRNSTDGHLSEQIRAFLPLVEEDIVTELGELDSATRVDHELLEAVFETSPRRAMGLAEAIITQARHPLREDALARLAAQEPERMARLALVSEDEATLRAVARGLDVSTLTDPMLAELARRILETQPLADDPPLESRGGFDSPKERARDQFRTQRQAACSELARRGQVAALVDLAEARPRQEHWWLKRLTEAARQAVAERDDRRPSPVDLLVLLERADARFVTNSRELTDVVLAHLEDVQRAVAAGDWRFLWNTGEPGARPKAEDDISDWVAQQLQSRVGRSGVADREIQVTRPAAQGIGRRVDVTVTAGTEHHRLMIEAKHLDNRELRMAPQNQLVERYLAPSNRTWGIYLVYWLSPDQRPEGWTTQMTTKLECFETVRELCATIEPPFRVLPYVLDISRPLEPR
jgi:hypothetical protein